MRNTRKILIALLVVMTLLVSMATLFASAAAPEKLYLTPNANWKQSNARFAAYFFGNGEKWVSMTDADGDGVYEVDVPAGYPNVIFCRMNPSATANNWNNKWNQTADLTIPTSGANHYTVKEGTWDSGGGTWSTYGSSCMHTNLSAEATCTTPQTCLDCGDPVVSALGHSFNSSHLCTRCNEQATFTVAGSGAHMGTEWDTGNTANDMTYDAETGTYTKVYEKVAAGSYAFKVVRDHSWGTAYPTSDKLYTVADAGSTVTITLKGTTVSVKVELPVVECNHNWSDATCDKPQICSECGQSQGEALGHKFDDGFKCSVCDFAPVYTVAGDNTALFGTAWDPTNTANKMSYDKESGLWTISYVNSSDATIWPNLKVCLDLGWTKCWGGAAAGQTDDNAWVEVPAGKMLTIAFDSTTEKITFTISDPPHVHSYFYPCDPVCQECYEISNPDAKHNVVHVEAVAATCYENGNIEYWYCSDCGTAWADEAQTQQTNMMNVITPMGHAPATHVEAVAPTCYENGNLEYWFCEACGQAWLDADCTQNTNLLAVVLPMAHGEAKHVEAKNATCTAEGNIEYWLCEACGQAWLDEACTLNTNVKSVILPMSEHSFADGKCTACGAADPDYEAPAVNNNVIDFSQLEEFPKGTYTDGAEQKYNDIFTFYHGKDSRIDGSSKTFEDGFAGTLRFGFGGKWKTVDGGPGRGLQINAPAAGTITLWWVSGGAGRSVDLLNASFDVIATTGTDAVAADGIYITTFEIPAAGVYYLTNIVNNNYWFKVEYAEKTEAPHEHVFVDGKCECGETDPNYVPPHVNTLVVGDTNKIVVSGNFVNDYNLPIEWVSFVADENAFYSFVGDNGALAFIFGADGSLISATGAANLEAGNYLICVGNGVVGEFNVAVTKSAWVNALAIGDNKLLITDALDNGAGYYIVWVAFEVTEKANYTFTGDGILALVYDSAYQAVAGTELEVGTYNVCVAFLTPATTGVATVKVEKTAIGDAPIEPELPALQLGDNTVVIDGSQTNLTGNAVAWYTFTPAEAGTYKFACSDLTVYILTSQNMGDLNAYIGADGVAELEAGTMYYILVGKDGVTGEFTVNVESGAAPAHKNTIVVGDNKYIISDSLLATEYEFLLIEITEGGIYKFTGGAPMTVFVFHDPYVGEALDATAPYTDNIDDITYDYVESFYVNLATPGYYWVGFRYDYVEEAREFDINVSLHSEHSYSDGKCECGETDPNYQAPVDPQPEEELNFFQKILKAITDFFANIANWFKGLFAKK